MEGAVQLWRVQCSGSELETTRVTSAGKLVNEIRRRHEHLDVRVIGILSGVEGKPALLDEELDTVALHALADRAHHLLRRQCSAQRRECSRRATQPCKETGAWTQLTEGTVE